jgi:hypothetical protein
MTMQPLTLNPEPGPAFAYVYNGDWVADCPRGCGGVEFLFGQVHMGGPRDLRKNFYQCSNCGHATERIVWPRRFEEIMEVLNRRPMKQTRNWYPRDHPVAVRFKVPHGQTPAELLAEGEEHGVV